uniref:Ubiquitin-like domain-containing protein n=1 Tax=Leersia perrieri TaxID=77586 RepID=A0A0D9XYF0_9ORYZ
MEVTFEVRRGLRPSLPADLVETFKMDVWYDSTVKRIKETVKQNKGIDVHNQRLFFGGVELQDNRNTEYYSILENSTVIILVPLNFQYGGGAA